VFTFVLAFLAISFPPDKQQEIVNSAHSIALILIVISASLFIVFFVTRNKMVFDKNEQGKVNNSNENTN